MTTTDASTEAGLGVSASPPRENLIRAIHPGVELVRSEGEEMPTLVGHFAVFNRWTEINSMFEGNFMERFAPGSFTKTINESKGSMRVLFDHGHDPQLGNKVLGPIRSLAEDGKGAAYEVPLLDTSYNRDLIPGLDAGVYGASFRFRVMKEEFVQKPARSKQNPDGLPERTVTEAQVMEFGPVTFPAYKDASAGLRSLTDEFLVARLARDPERFAGIATRAGISLNGTDPTSVWTSTGAGITINISHPEARTETIAPPAEADTPPEPDAEPQERTDEEPEPSEATTPTDTDETKAFAFHFVKHEIRASEPEPSEATTRSNRGLFWFADEPRTKGAK